MHPDSQDRFYKSFKLFFFLFSFLICSVSLWLCLELIGIKKHIKQIDINTKKIDDNIKQINVNIKQIDVNVGANLDIVLKAFIAEKVESLTKDKNSDEEKVIALAQWVSSNISNRFQATDIISDSATSKIFTDKGNLVNTNLKNPMYTHFAVRSGACGARSSIFIEMLKYLNIQAKFYNIFCFPYKENGHTNVQVYYNESWHFFDVTYAGYFKKSNKILSFEELIKCAKNNEDYLKYMVVFPQTLDYYTGSNMTKVVNQKRMESVYSRDKLINASQYGYLSKPDGPCKRLP